MGSVIKKVVHVPKDGEDWDEASAVELSTARNIQVNAGWGSIKDDFSITLSNGSAFFDDKFTSVTPYIEEEDLIRIYIKDNAADSYTFVDDDLIIEGTVRQANQEVNESGNIVTINGFNFAEVFFDAEIPFPPFNEEFDDSGTCMEMARAIVDFLSDAMGVPISWDTTNPSVKKDGITSFPTKNLALNYTPVFVILEKIFSTEFTEDGQYYWYLKKSSGNQRLLTVLPKTNTTQSLVFDQNLMINNLSIERGKDTVKNFVIYNAGIDLYGHSVEDYTVDVSSVGKYGWKTHYMVEETGMIFGALFQEEVKNNAGSFSFDAEGNINSNFPTSYPYTFSFDATKSAANDAEFNNVIKVEALRQGLEQADRLIEQTSIAQYVVTATIPFRNDLVLGGLYDIQLSRARPFSRKLRLKEIRHIGAKTTAVFDEDEKDKELTGR